MHRCHPTLAERVSLARTGATCFGSCIELQPARMLAFSIRRTLEFTARMWASRSGRICIMPQHIGIVACSAQGAALCYRTICTEGAQLLGPHAHPETSVHTHSLNLYMERIYRG